MEIEIREAEPGDARGIARVHLASWRAAYTGIVSDKWLSEQTPDNREESWTKSLNEIRKGRKIFVALRASEIFGFAVAGPSRDPRYEDYAELWAIYIPPAHFGAGGGRALLSAAATHIRDLGYDRMFVNVLRDNKIGRAFYERMGGQLIEGSAGKVPLGDQDYDDIKYQWKEL